VGHHKPAYGKKDKPTSANPTLATDKQGEATSRKDNSKGEMNPHEPKWLGLTRFERIMAVLTLAGVLIALLTSAIFFEQLKEMRIDQRAWVGVTSGNVQMPKDETFIDKAQVTVNLTMDNSGKTAARTISSRFVMEYVVNGDHPEFIYQNRISTFNSTGIIFPHSPQPIAIGFSQGSPKSTVPTKEYERGIAVPRFLTKSEFDDLGNGNAYMAVYGETDYLEIFGTEHWLHYCTFFVRPNTNVVVTAKQCTDYNDTDNNSYLFPSLHF
jgi:hypothetical protein